MSAMAAGWRVASMAVLLALGACARPSAAPNAPPSPAPPQRSAPLMAREADRGIAWVGGGLNAAFDAARRSGKPILLYWGASWCPWCLVLKASVFQRADFIAKTALFIPVYLDGDDPGAQRWGEQFRVQGYPTLLILDAHGRELQRIAGSLDVTQYAGVLDLALADSHSVDELLIAARQGAAPSAQVCQRLALNGWLLQDELADAAQAARLASVAQRCAPMSAPSSARLGVLSVYFATRAADQGQLDPAARAAMRAQIETLGRLLADPAQALALADVLQELDAPFLKATQLLGAEASGVLLRHYIATMQAASTDARYSGAEQLTALAAALRAAKYLNGGQVPGDAARAANQRLASALSAAHEPFLRAGLIDGALSVYEELDTPKPAYDLVRAELAGSTMPYYYRADLAQLAEAQGHAREALDLYAEAYQEAQGPATRFQWGASLVSSRIRLAPNDAAAIERAGLEVLGDLEGDDRIYRRVRVRLERMDRELRAWNQAAGGAHADVLRTLRQRARQTCQKIPANEPAHASCERFLAEGASPQPLGALRAAPNPGLLRSRSASRWACSTAVSAGDS